LNFIVKLPALAQAYILEHCFRYETISVLYSLIFSRSTKFSFHSWRWICCAYQDYYIHFTCSGSIVTESDPSVNSATENVTGRFEIVLSV